MEGISAAVSQSTEAMNDVLRMAATEKVEMAQKLVRVQAEMTLSAGPGKGQNLNLLG